jgi:ankyrin repeat protein
VHFACKRGHTKIVRLLLKHGAKFDSEECLNLACQARHFQIGVLFFEEDVFEDVLLYAARHGYFKLMTLLIQKGANIQQKNRNKENCLMMACQGYYCLEDYVNIVKFLIHNGVDVQEKNYEGQTALHFVNNHEMAKLLILNGANVNAKCKNGETPLHSVTQIFNADVRIAELLIAHGAKIETKCKRGKTAVTNAIENDKFDVAEFLIKNGSCMEIELNCFENFDHDSIERLNPKISFCIENKIDIYYPICYQSLPFDDRHYLTSKSKLLMNQMETIYESFNELCYD